MIDADRFRQATGRLPDQDDLERVNCAKVGQLGHWSCGWCDDCDRPRFLCGHLVREPPGSSPEPESGHIEFRGDWNRILWSSRSPDAGDPACLCSYCGAWIPGDALPLRLFNPARNLEARFCDQCAETCFGMVSFGASDEDADGMS